MKIKTEILKEMISKAIKGSSMNKLLPITNYIGIQFEPDQLDNGYGFLTLITTDGNNQLKIKNNSVEGSEQFYTIVNVDTFSKLVSKTTSENIELENKENYLEVKANNGTYKLEIPINEEGKMVEFPKQEILIENEKLLELKTNIENFKSNLLSIKTTVAKTMEIPCLTGYYLGNKNVGTDRQVMCCIDNKLFEEPLLLSSEMVELLQLLDNNSILRVAKYNNKLLFETENISIYGPELEGKDIYPVQSIENVINLSYDNTIKVNKQDLLNVLERLEIFVRRL